MARDQPAPDECANCGADIPRNAHACPECGADERTGWRETSIYDGLDLPEPESHGKKRRPDSRRRTVPIFWTLIGLGLLALLALNALGVGLF